MSRLLAGFLLLLMLLQMFNRELVVVDYQVRKGKIIQLYCVNKARPQLHCDGKCYLSKQLRKAEEAGSKAPAGLAKMQYEMLPGAAVVLRVPVVFAPAEPQFAPRPAVQYAFSPVHGVFHPPSFLV